MILALSNSQISLVRVNYSSIKRQSIRDLKTMLELINSPLRSIWPNVHGVSISPLISFVVRFILMIKERVRAGIREQYL